MYQMERSFVEPGASAEGLINWASSRRLLRFYISCRAIPALISEISTRYRDIFLRVSGSRAVYSLTVDSPDVGHSSSPSVFLPDLQPSDFLLSRRVVWIPECVIVGTLSWGRRRGEANEEGGSAREGRWRKRTGVSSSREEGISPSIARMRKEAEVTAGEPAEKKRNTGRCASLRSSVSGTAAVINGAVSETTMLPRRHSHAAAVLLLKREGFVIRAEHPDGRTFLGPNEPRIYTKFKRPYWIENPKLTSARLMFYVL